MNSCTKEEILMDEDLIEVKLSSVSVYDGKLLHVKKDTVQLPNGHQATREWIKHPGASAVIPVLPDGRIVLVRQYRYPVQQITLEIPAGKLDSPEEDPYDCAMRELQEETGYTTPQLIKLTTIATTVGFTDERIHIYAAKDLTPGKQNPDDDEFIHVLKVPLSEAAHMITDGRICDAKSVTAILMLREQLRNA